MYLERFTGKPVDEMSGYTGTLFLLFGCLVNANEHLDMTFMQFVHALDRDAELMQEMSLLLNQQMEEWGHKPEQAKDDSKKKD